MRKEGRGQCWGRRGGLLRDLFSSGSEMVLCFQDAGYLMKESGSCSWQSYTQDQGPDSNIFRIKEAKICDSLVKEKSS